MSQLTLVRNTLALQPARKIEASAVFRFQSGRHWGLDETCPDGCQFRPSGALVHLNRGTSLARSGGL